jgi:hypothetical protein
MIFISKSVVIVRLGITLPPMKRRLIIKESEIYPVKTAPLLEANVSGEPRVMLDHLHEPLFLFQCRVYTEGVITPTKVEPFGWHKSPHGQPIVIFEDGRIFYTKIKI